MQSSLPFFQVLGAMARHAAAAQETSAGNIARADEPGYKAREVESFGSYMARAAPDGQFAGQRAGQAAPFRVLEAAGPASPNGNTVNLEDEVFRSADAGSQHNLALTAYAKSLDLMRIALGKRV